jgi:outer membrane lipoprotein-sorting protein
MERTVEPAMRVLVPENTGDYSLKEARMKFLMTALGFFVTVAFASAAAAQTDSATEKMINEVIEKTKDIASYKVDMKTETQMMGQMTVSDGEMAYKKPDMMHMTTTSDMMGGMKQEIYSKGDIVWTYMPMMNMATKLDLSKIKGEVSQYDGGLSDSANITNPFEGLPKDKIKYLGQKTVDNKKVHIFEAAVSYPGQMPTAQSQQQKMLPKKINMLIIADSGLPYRIMAYGEDGSLMMQQTYSNFRLDIPIDDSEFEFSPPEGTQVMDMTQGAMNMMKQMQGSQSGDQ